MKKSWPEYIPIVIAIGSLSLAFFVEYIFRENEAAKWMAFSAAMGVFLVAMWYELKQIKDSTIKAHGTIDKQFADILANYPVYPILSPNISKHFVYLLRLAELKNNKFNGHHSHKEIFKGYLRYWFQDYVDENVKICCENIDGNGLRAGKNTYDTLYKFFRLAWDSVECGSKIDVTSIVPYTFWENAHDYLDAQHALIKNRGITITRYFIFIPPTFHDIEKFKKIFHDNYKHGILVRAVLLTGEEEIRRHFNDTAIIGDEVRITNVTDPSDNSIVDSIISVRQGSKDSDIDALRSSFLVLEKHDNTIYYESCKKSDTFLKKILTRTERLAR